MAHDGSMPAPRSRIVIGYCSHDRTHAGFTYDYGHLIGYFVANGGMVEETGKDYALALEWCMTSILPEGRQRLVEAVKAKGANKLLWLDTDMRFPRQTLNMLLRHDVPIVGANYVARRPPYRFTAATEGNVPLETRPDSTGLVEVEHLGFGCLLTDISIFEDEGPWFAFDWYRRQEDNKWGAVGEDVFFCREMRARGHKVYVDQELSATIGHIGEFTFTADEMVRVEEIGEPEKVDSGT